MPGFNRIFSDVDNTLKYLNNTWSTKKKKIWNAYGVSAEEDGPITISWPYY